jgi:uncharacterized protein
VGPTLSLSAAQARALHLAAQGLLVPPAGQATRAGLLRAIARMELLQIDTIHVVARSPYLVLFSRLGPYPATWLDEALASGRLVECWAHEACFAPARDLLLLRGAQELRSHWAMKRAQRTYRAHRPAIEALLDRIREDGPVKAADFAREARTGPGWWDWKKEKLWLEAAFALGHLLVARRETFHRVYDLAERVQPAAGAPLPARVEVERALRERSVRALGVTRARWVHDYFRVRPRLRDRDLGALLDDGAVVEVEVEGWDSPGYVHRDHLPLARRVASGRLVATRTALLSPFDPVVWDRERAGELFGFDYRLECYVPAPRRKHGYFVLPVLHRGKLVGRLDAKAHRAEGAFEVKVLRLEPGVRAGEALLADLAGALTSCAAWHGTPVVKLGRGVETSLRRPLAAMLQGRAADASQRPRV